MSLRYFGNENEKNILAHGSKSRPLNRLSVTVPTAPRVALLNVNKAGINTNFQNYSQHFLPTFFYQGFTQVMHFSFSKIDNKFKVISMTIIFFTME